MVSYRYSNVRLGDIELGRYLNPQNGGCGVLPDTIVVNDEECVASSRFWQSLYSRFGFNQAFFRYFTQREVFDRIAEVRGNLNMTVCIGDEEDNKLPMAYGASVATRPPINADDVIDLFDRSGLEPTDAGGVVYTVCDPTVGGHYTINGDEFRPKYKLSVPVDGYGSPFVCLMMFRVVCSNGVIAEAPIFRSKVNTKDGPMHTLGRIIESYNDDEGYAALRQRIDSSAKSWASLRETNSLLRDIAKTTRCSGDESLEELRMKNSAISELLEIAGNPLMAYGITHIDAISRRRQAMLPVACTMYDLLNFASEYSTHHLKSEADKNTIDRWLGVTLSSEYDLEDSVDQFQDHRDLFMKSKLKAGVTGNN